MNKIKLLSSIFLLGIIIAILCNCNGSANEEGNRTDSVQVKTDLPLNISIYLDLSDRIVRDLTPSQSERDSAIVMLATEYVKQHAVKKKILPAKDKIKVFFYPAPSTQKIALLSNDLELDLSSIEPASKKQALLDFQSKFANSIHEIYSETVAQSKWVGSDIWGFFNKPIDTYCIKEGYRNIIIILTDGYIYHVNNKIKDGSNYSYILPQTLDVPNSGLIVSRKGLDNLEVLFMEINPTDPKKQTQMEAIIENWLKGMGVKKYYIGETDVPSNTKMILDKFINNKD